MIGGKEGVAGMVREVASLSPRLSSATPIALSSALLKGVSLRSGVVGGDDLDTSAEQNKKSISLYSEHWLRISIDLGTSIWIQSFETFVLRFYMYLIDS